MATSKLTDMTPKGEGLTGNNLMLVLALITLLVTGATGLIAKSLITGIIRDTKVVEAKLKADDALKGDLDAAPKLVADYKGLGAQTTLLSDALPNTVDFPSLIVSIENMGLLAGVKVKTIAPAQLQVTNTAPAATNSLVPVPQVYPFNITYDGSFDAVKRLMAALETSARPMHITGLQMTGSGSSMSGSMDLETYFQAKADLPFSTETIK